jgi:hypothetical protein
MYGDSEVKVIGEASILKQLLEHEEQSDTDESFHDANQDFLRNDEE